MSRERKFREKSEGATHTNNSNDDAREKKAEEEEEDRSLVAHSGRGGSAAIGKNAAPFSENGNGMTAGAAGGDGGARDAAALPPGELQEYVAVGGAGGVVGGVGGDGREGNKAPSHGVHRRELDGREGGLGPASRRRRIKEEQGRRDAGGEGGDGDKRCPGEL